ncbi:uncharacterized protein LOC128241181 [Mya arenaria]|uniref:uncharacterized protein LOC128241181 n=1 Tax=Mya arenaria TaxID=6604 RepID=UPI0022E1230C|nr:uncharacterized protein LOC128241181 [Mya arenaria]
MFNFKEDKVILKCLFDDLEDLCELQEEVTGSDDGNTNDVVACTTKINKTRRELTAMLNQIKQDSEKDRKSLFDELQRVKQDLDNSETKRTSLEQELMKAKQGIKEARKIGMGLEQKLLKAKQFKEKSKKGGAEFKDNINWTQPTRTVNVTVNLSIIELAFTFPDGLQTQTHHPTPGNSSEVCTFTGRLCYNNKGELLCRMLKEAFSRGLIFTLGNEGKVVLDGVSLFYGQVYVYRMEQSPAYVEYTQTLERKWLPKASHRKTLI